MILGIARQALQERTADLHPAIQAYMSKFVARGKVNATSKKLPSPKRLDTVAKMRAEYLRLLKAS